MYCIFSIINMQSTIIFIKGENMKTKLVIFDMDGTLFRTETVDIVAMNKALSDNGFKALSDEEILALIGATLDEFCDTLIGSDNKSLKTKFFDDVIKYEIEEIEESGKLYDGVTDFLENLVREGFTLCICSNGSKEYIDAIINRFNLKKYFKEIWSHTAGISKTEAVGIINDKFAVDAFIMVGDRSYDIEAAKENGGVSIGVTYGFGKEEVLLADYTCNSIHEVEEVIYKINLEERVKLCVE